ncbi:MAG: hydroxyacid dehydrogenase [Haliea sp.]|nr:MAG: hydroxyacid dehydrogenase [Haliea sp.]
MGARRASVLICEFMDGAAVDRLREFHDVDYRPELVDQPAALMQAAAPCDALIVRNRTQVRGALLGALARCRVVGRLGVGLDNIDVDACEARGIAVIPATGANALSVAEYVIATAMLLLRGAYGSTPQVAAGAWPRAALGQGRETRGKTLGIIGFGSIGRMVGGLAQSLGMRVIGYDAFLSAGDQAWREAGVVAVSLDELVAKADVVTLHVPLLEATRGLFGAGRIARMKPGAVLINTSRGEVVDAAAVAAALRSGRLGGAALDVFQAEPLPATPYLQDCPHLLLTPHISGVSAESNERVSALIADRVIQFFNEAGA